VGSIPHASIVHKCSVTPFLLAAGRTQGRFGGGITEVEWSGKGARAGMEKFL
jgi:hypothetical protein